MTSYRAGGSPTRVHGSRDWRPRLDMPTSATLPCTQAPESPPCPVLFPLLRAPHQAGEHHTRPCSVVCQKGKAWATCWQNSEWIDREGPGGGLPLSHPSSGGRHGPRPSSATVLAPWHPNTSSGGQPGMGVRAGKGGVCMGSCQGLGVGLGGCPPQVGASPLYQTCCLPFFSLWAQVLPLSWGWGWGTWHPMGWAVCSSIGTVSL